MITEQVRVLRDGKCSPGNSGRESGLREAWNEKGLHLKREDI